jgi:predicted HTH transcriptional regulator
MGAIPESTLPGHKQLHDRAVAALDRCQEDRDIDFKQSAEWPTLQWRITHAVLGLGNLRDGGLVIVGVSEDQGRWVFEGVSETQLSTYDPDIVINQVNAHVSPHVDLDIVVVTYRDTKKYLTIYAREFGDSPLVCKKNGPQGSGISEGRVYVRPPGMARTTVVTDARQMHELLELAAEKRARRILETSRRIGLTFEQAPLQQGTSQRFDRELEGL